jgi:thiol-disulfide isomerase/thioredoxin
VAEGDGLLNRYTGKTVSGVRIPLSPPTFQRYSQMRIHPASSPAPLSRSHNTLNLSWFRGDRPSLPTWQWFLCWFLFVAALGILVPSQSAGADFASPAVSDSSARQAGVSQGNDPKADQAWKELSSLSPPADPPEWATRPPSEEDRRAHQKKQADFACRASDLARDFYTRFPAHEMAGWARGLENNFLGPFKADVLDYRAERIQQQALKKKAEGESAVLAEMEKGTREMLKQFPEHFVPNQLLLKIARRLDPEKGRRLVEEVRDTKGIPEFVKHEATELLKKLDAIGKPFALQCTAVDGREVDLGKLKGKVVLVDFWATWCVPCVAELPSLKATYARMAPQGFEIVGISFDQKKEVLTRFLEKEQIAWPQFFDGKGWKNQFGREYGIESIPTMWLVDKRGVLRDLNARGSLQEKVEKLMAESP